MYYGDNGLRANDSEIGALTGLTLARVTVDTDRSEILFYSECGRMFIMVHDQDCCETVTIDDICGDITDIVGSPIVKAMESTSIGSDPLQDSETWTFYKIDTIKGGVTIRWYGTSNGYYSESASFYEVIGGGNIH